MHEEKSQYNKEALKRIEELSGEISSICEQHNIPHILSVCTCWGDHDHGGENEGKVLVETSLTLTVDKDNTFQLPPNMRAALGMLHPNSYMNIVSEDVFNMLKDFGAGEIAYHHEPAARLH